VSRVREQSVAMHAASCRPLSGVGLCVGMRTSRTERCLVDLERRQRELQQRQDELVRGRREVSLEAFLSGVAGIVAVHNQMAIELRQLRFEPRSTGSSAVEEYLDVSLLS
jgi:hypothetical protein